MYSREIEADIMRKLKSFPAVGILGPRNIGKTTLALEIAKKYPHIYLDLEKKLDYEKIDKDDPFNYFMLHKDKLVILDEVQAYPHLFKSLRGVIDAGGREGYKYGRFLILGSASQDLINQSSQNLTGRISYVKLTGLSAIEVEKSQDPLSKLWLRGGLPISYCSKDHQESFEWRESFIQNYIRKDVSEFLDKQIPASTLENLWSLLAVYHSELWNPSELARALMLSYQEVNHYLRFLDDLFLARILLPWHKNIRKPLRASPKVYLRDSGTLHQIWGISEYSSLLAHPYVGKSWEGFVIENILSTVHNLRIKPYFFRDTDGSEIDLLLEIGGEGLWALEIKLSKKPKIPKGFYRACESLGVKRKFVIYSGEKTLSLSHGIKAMSLLGFMKLLKKHKV